jgi:hypothetical protein
VLYASRSSFGPEAVPSSVVRLLPDRGTLTRGAMPQI